MSDVAAEVNIDTQAAPEAVRLVIWDLDETFWMGTLTEGGHTYQQSTHEIVLELARRGIMSSICSKNDLETVRAIFVEQGIWDYFIFPSINWLPKGQRIRELVERAQLRPATVLFIDDNPMNLNEAKALMPDLQIANETMIPELLNNWRFKGKDDRGLARLAQYKLLEARTADQAATGDNTEFLRSSNIRVEIIYDIEPHLDRAIELINRTNQLNFTKVRLPEEIGAARAALRALLNRYEVQAGLVHVTDRYGDYGLCGFYCLRTGALGTRLEHFCFSCRTLNMGVETWLFEQLKRPRIQVVGEVLTDLKRADLVVDWINAENSGADADKEDLVKFDKIILHGGCDLMQLALYLQRYAGQVVGEFNLIRRGAEVRIDHSGLLALALEQPSNDVAAALERLGYEPQDLVTSLGQPASPNSIVILSFSVDALLPLYRHKELGFVVPVLLPLRGPGGSGSDVTRWGEEQLLQRFQGHWALAVARELRQHYVFEGRIDEPKFKANFRRIMEATRDYAHVFIIGLNERKQNAPANDFMPMYRGLNTWVREEIDGQPNFRFINIRQFVVAESEVDAHHPSHFNRMVYHRLFEHIIGAVGQTTLNG